ncbi:hypothetical protein K9M48_00560 [Candidatus Gracilibacteria bacterium]|nr:hypothetical protein [Candidatus Gracilibacteria bacterium]
MKKTIIAVLFLSFFISFSFAYQQQGFDNYNEANGSINFKCTNQCFLLIGPVVENDFININGDIQGNGVIGYGFLVGEQIYPGETLQINGGNIDKNFVLAGSQIYSQIPGESQLVLLFQGSLQGNNIGINGGIMGVFDKFFNGFNQSLEYKPYNPRTINFLEGPMRNGKYINQAFFKTILILILLSFISYIFSSKKDNKRKSIYFGIGILVFFRIFFDFFSTVNEIKIYKDVMDAPNIMENGRVGKDSDFYQFLDFIKTKVPNGEKGAFIAPYPFYFEGKYHIYPDVKFDLITGVNYIFYFNSYGLQAPFDFKDPIYSDGILFREKLEFKVDQEIIRNPHAKIYILKK